MSKTPPRKKLRQTSLTDMFKSSCKDSVIMEYSVPENKQVEGNTKQAVVDNSITKVTLDSNVINAANDNIETETNLTFGLLSDSYFSEDQDTSTGSCNLKEKSPQKGHMKKHMMGKSKKKRKHISDPNVKGESSSRESDHKNSANAGFWEMPESKGSPSVKSKRSTEESCDGSPSKVTWRGCPISSLQVLSSCKHHVPAIRPASDHTVMVQLPLPDTGPPDPHPSSYSDIWDQHHVRMPCSPKSLYPVTPGSDTLVPRWSIICKALQRDMRCVGDLKNAILEYNSRYAEKWNFKGLQQLLQQEFEEEERDHFFNHTLPAMISLSLDLPNLVTQPPLLLTRHSTHSITLSQLQIASLLANAFFCTYPRRNAKGGDTEYASYPDINFNRLFFHKEKRSLEKMKCLINYFRRVTTKRPDGLLTFTRQYVSFKELPSWETSSHHLPELHLNSSGLIEEMEGLLQVDFANKYVGGGVLGLGCVQEEIRFVLSPELLVSRLFTQVLDRTEALIVTGGEQYNHGAGYASTFSWTGSHQDKTPRDKWNRRLCQIVAIDALHFNNPKAQYRTNLVVRELNKVYAGYRLLNGSIGVPIGVATGNWGCGAFKGNARLKSLIQLAACGYVGRDVAYFTFGDEELRNDISTMHIFLKENNVTVGELVQVLIQYGQQERVVDGSDLYHYIYHNLGAYESETDSGNENSKDCSSNADKAKHAAKKSVTYKSGSATKVVSEYFKKTDCPRTSSSHSGSGESSNNSSSSNKSSTAPPTSSEVVKDDNLTEEKIVQVLKECDRLVEDQKKKNQDNSSSGVEETLKDNRYHIENSDNRSEIDGKSVENTKEKSEENITKTNKSNSEPSKLLSCLDDIDKNSSTKK